MKINFAVQASHLNSAIDAVQDIVPRPVGKDKSQGFFFAIRNGSEGFLYSTDAHHCARASMPIFDTEGEGVFAYPHESIGAFKYFSGPISFEASREGDSFAVRYDPGNQAGGTRPSFDPKWFSSFDRELNEAQEVGRFPSAVLREALNLSKIFHGENNPRAADQHATIQMFDKDYECEDPKNKGHMYKPYEKGDGVLYASNGTQAFFFECDAFKGKSFAIKAEHLGLLLGFLGRIQGPVIVKSAGEKTTYVTNEDGSRVFGWQQTTKLHLKHSYYGLNSDKFIFSVPKDDMLDALGYMREELGKGHDKVKLIWNPDGGQKGTIQFEAAEGNAKGMHSMLVAVTPDPSTPEPGRKLETFVNLNQLQSLFKDVKGGDVKLRVYITDPTEKRPKGGALLRTIDEFNLDTEGEVVVAGTLPAGAVKCTVTRFMPSYE